MSFEEAKTWYDGYQLVAHRQWKDECYSMYNPKSVVEAMLRHKFGTYWNQTETYEALKIYIQMDMDGLKASVIRMLTGDSVSINTGTFSNDMTTFATKDDVLTLLVHLGYLTYNSIDGTVSIPNKEVSQEYINAISTMSWHGVADLVEASRKLLEALCRWMPMPLRRESKKRMKRYRFFNTMMKIRLVVPFILRFILHGNIIQ